MSMYSHKTILHLHNAFCILKLEAERQDRTKGQLLQHRDCNILLSCCVWLRCGCQPLCYSGHAWLLVTVLMATTVRRLCTLSWRANALLCAVRRDEQCTGRQNTRMQGRPCVSNLHDAVT